MHSVKFATGEAENRKRAAYRHSNKFKDHKMLTHDEIAHIVTVLYPGLIKKIHSFYVPLSNDTSIIPEVYEVMLGQNPDMEEWERKTLFVALIYRIFKPSSYLPAPTDDLGHRIRTKRKLILGVRGAAAAVLGFNSGEMINHYKPYAEFYIKNPRYRAKMKRVTDQLGLTQSSDEKSDFLYTRTI